ncbi:hypothetical protein O6H91_16G069100 [Diphasiastrum complanatum]|uniref:Uncharacterized protein n=2 Tax=Diphasiastrum complanatum TaxID=34168 RepID=A0ACC2BCB8_DIPCM|nr:hypothetical protein O6H91_16G051000 [Diphasiastrum complanatum]KAJ7527742.1 hypothetical protein O6H91_16G069100 [Diphasiastrum complanatum]
MAASEEMSSLFPIFILSVLGLFVIPWTIYQLTKAVQRHTKSMHCRCSLCLRSPKYQTSLLKRIGKFSTCSNVTLVLLWIVMSFLVYYIKTMTREIQPFEPFSILGLDASASETEIKKAYRKLSILYHPDKNPDPEANKYFVDYISKAYQALTDPVARENFAKWGHPDGRQGMQMGIALPLFLLDMHGAAAGILLLGLVGFGILLPLMVAVVYLSRSSKYTGNYVMHQTLSSYYYFMKPSLAPSKVMDVLIRAAEFIEIPIRRSDNEPLQKLFITVRSELNLDPKNLKQEQTKFWKQHPAVIKTELLLLAHLTRQSAAVPDGLKADFAHVLRLTPRLLEELMKMAMFARNAEGHGWLRPALGVMELSQSIFQAVPLSARKVSERAAASGGSLDGVAPFLQLPHFTDAVVKKLGRKKIRSLQDLKELNPKERAELLITVGGFSEQEAVDVELVLNIMPAISLEAVCETEGEEGVQEGDIVTLRAWITLKRGNNLVSAHPHAPYFPYLKDETCWLLLADIGLNSVWVSQKVTFIDEGAAISQASKAIHESLEGTGASDSEINIAVKEAIARVKAGSRLVMVKFQAPSEGTYNLTAFCLSDTWIGCDKKFNIKFKVGKKTRTGVIVEESALIENGQHDEDANEDEDEDYDEEYESEYSEDEDDEDSKASKKSIAEPKDVSDGGTSSGIDSDDNDK